MKIAVGFIHGIGKQKPDFYEEMAEALARRLSLVCPEIELVAEGIYWGDITDRIEDKLIAKLAPYKLRWDNWIDARGFMISFAGDAIAYQPIPKADNPMPHEYIYTDIHERVARKLQCLARRAGPDAPLCLIGHSLGTIVASNYLYDLQNRKLPPRIQSIIAFGNTPLERGETLSHLYTMGSPIALWTLRYDDFGKPVTVPVPRFQQKGIGEWVNFYDKDDVIAYPIKPLSEPYNRAVTEDIEVCNPGLMAWTPLGSHGGYFESAVIQDRICGSLAEMYRVLNPQ
ncbi:chemotaxis protein [Paenibacillus sp. LHD-117]|uniref:chemotaxis protein n=1 Tax=Paenibacillus sp. LHD-117 TaxID=3071412 RepID=UPI0027E1FDEC|nr:chemotaxis protein [Paenibacillus sp. LHD-117]MDQ6418761.1 chemotaxis protein [Paenibacillus sp. LHD-117]